MKENKKILIACIVGACVFVCLLITFFVSSKEYFSGDFAPHAIVSNTDVGGISSREDECCVGLYDNADKRKAGI